MEIVGQLTGGVVHDFNNILTVITGTIEVLAEAVADRPELAAVAGLIAEAAARGANLTSHLLAFARGQPSQPRDVDVNTLLVDAARLLRPTLGEQIEIDSTGWRRRPRTWVDPSQLMTALLNLAIMARDAMPEGGKLTFESRSRRRRRGVRRRRAGNFHGRRFPPQTMSRSRSVSRATGTAPIAGNRAFADLGMATDFATRADGNIRVFRAAGREASVEIHLPRAADLIRPQAAPSGKTDM